MKENVKVLIIRFSSIGDIVLTTPVIRCVKQQLNEGKNTVHYLTKKSFAPVLKASPYIDELKTIQKSANEIIEELDREGYDYIFDLHHNLRTARVKRRLKALSFSFYKANIEKWLLVNFKIDRMPQKHIVDRYMDTTKAFGIENDHRGLDYFIPEEEAVTPEILPEGFQNGYVAFAVGGRHPGKMLPAEKIIEICKGLNRKIVLLGGPEDAEKGNKIESEVPENVWNACGRFSLSQSASVIKHADVVISHDTGLMHIAAALKKRIISVWGATVPELGMAPYLPGKGSVIIEPKGVKDRPYSKLGDNKWYKPDFKGMEEINTSEIINAVDNEKTTADKSNG